MKALKDFFRNYIDDDKELDDFALWAFGKDFDMLDHGLWFMNEWNKRHHHEYALSANGFIDEDSKIMVSLWKQSITDGDQCS